MLGILLQITTLAALMYAIARHEADISWSKLFMVFVPMIIVMSLLGAVIGLPVFFVYFVGIMVALKLWFYVDWPKAGIIAFCQIVVTVLISLGIEKLLS